MQNNKISVPIIIAGMTLLPIGNTGVSADIAISTDNYLNINEYACPLEHNLSTNNVFSAIGNDGQLKEYSLERGEKMEVRNVSKNMKILDDFLSLPDNWNGYGARPFSHKHLAQVKGILLDIPIQPEVFPTASSSIQFEYEKSTGDYLEFELFSNECIKMFRIIGELEDEREITSITEMKDIINEFYKA